MPPTIRIEVFPFVVIFYAESMRKLKLYNFEFPLHTNEFVVNGYKFYKVDNYEERRQGLQQLVNVTDDQVVTCNTGTHQQTGFVEIPDNERPTVIYKDFSDGTELIDILLLMSLFTQRDVFAVDIDIDAPIIADPRVYAFGGGLVCSLPYHSFFYDENTGRTLEKVDIENSEVYWNERDVTLVEGISAIIALLNSKSWQLKYGDGYHLRLYRSAIKRLDPYVSMDAMNFLQCWTVWENIFALRNNQTMTDEQIRNCSGNEKIDFILQTYFKISTTIHSKQKVDELVKARNRIIHFGKHTSSLTHEKVLTFIRATEALVAMTLDLEPSNVHNYKEKLHHLLFE